MGQADAKGLLEYCNSCALQSALKETPPQHSQQELEVYQYTLEMLCSPAHEVLALKDLV